MVNDQPRIVVSCAVCGQIGDYSPDELSRAQYRATIHTARGTQHICTGTKNGEELFRATFRPD